MATVGAVWINVLPSMQGFASNLQRQATSAAKVAAVGAGRNMGRSMGDATVGAMAQRMTANSRRMQNTFTASTSVMTRGLSNFRSGFRDADAAASAFTGRMGSLGGAAARGMRPGVQAIGGFAAGFADAGAAASRFSGVTGTLGGVARRGLDPAVVAAQNLHAGFTDSSAAASAFTGHLGTFGGLARTALQPGITAVQGIGAGLRTAGTTAATAFGAMRSGVATAFAGVGTAVSSVATAGAGAASQLTGFFSNAASSAASSIRNVLGGAIGQIGAMLGAIGLGMLGSQIAEVAAGASTTEAQLTALYGAAGAGASEVNIAMDGMAERFRGMDMSVMRQGATSLAYMGLQGDEALGVLERMEAATRAAGSGATGMDRAFAALTKGVNSGKFQMVELNQISDAGIPIYDALADVLGVDIPKAQQMATDGAIGLEEVLQALSGDHGTWFPALLEGAENMDKTFSGAWDTIKNTIVNGFADQVIPLFDRAAPVMVGLADKVESGFQKLPGIISRVREVFAGLMEATGLDRLGAHLTGSIIPSFRNLWTAIQPLAVIIGTALVVGIRAVAEAAYALGPVLVSITGWLAENREMVTLVGVAILGGVAAYYALGVASAVITAITNVTKIWTIAQAAFNAVMAANPIMLVVIAIGALAAAAVYAYKNFEGFRNVVDTVWQAVKTAALWIWDKGLKPAFDALVTGIKWVKDNLWILLGAGPIGWVIYFATTVYKNFDRIRSAFVDVGVAAMGLWSDYIRPAVQWIWGLIKNVFTAIIVIAILPAIAVFKLLAATAMWLWNNAIKPAFQAIGRLAMWLWNNAIKPAFEAIAKLAKWLWNNAIKPAFAAAQAGIRALGRVFSWLWTNIVRPVFRWIGNYISTWWATVRRLFQTVINFVRGPLGAVFRWLRDNVIRPVWNAISTVINNVWQNGIKPAFDKVREGVRAMQRAFNAGRTAIARAWRGIRDSAKKPVNFLIGTVFNKGIRPIWNKVAGIVGADKIDNVSTFATGGVLPGYTPGRDVHMFYSASGGALALSGGEAIMRPEVTRAMGTDGVDRLNAAARSGGVAGVRDALGFHRGGVLPAPARFSRGGWLGVNDISPSSEGILSAAKKFIKDIAVDVFSGDLGAAVDTFFKPAKTATKRFGTKGFPGTPYQMVDKFNTSVKEKIESFIDFFTGDDAGGAFASVGKGKAGDVVRLARSTIGKYPESNGNNVNAITRWYGMNGAPWCAMYISWLFNKAKASGSLGRAARTAWTGDYYNSGMRRVSAGGRRPGDVVVYGTQHVNMYDGNGYTIGGNEGNNVRRSRGYAGRGAAFRPAWKAASGGILGRQSLRRIALQDPHDRDTEIGRSMRGLYDRGGYVQPGMTLVTNKTGQPEPVLTQGQWRDMHRLAESVGAGEGGELMRDAHIHLHESEATVREAFRSVDTELRKRRRGGVHAGRAGG